MDDTSSANYKGDPRSEKSPVIVGRIKGPWGLCGDLKVEVFSDTPSRFAPGSVLNLGDRTVRVERVRSAGGGLVVKFDAVSDRTAAEPLSGLLLTISQDSIAPLPPGSYYYFQLIEMEVWTDTGERLGNIDEILTTGSNDVYIVRDEGKEILIPGLEDVIASVDLVRSRMTVRLPDGLR